MIIKTVDELRQKIGKSGIPHNKRVTDLVTRFYICY